MESVQLDSLAQQVADSVSPAIVQGLKDDKGTIRATLSPVQRTFFPLAFFLLIQIVPGIILAIIKRLIDRRDEPEVRMLFQPTSQEE